MNKIFYLYLGVVIMVFAGCTVLSSKKDQSMAEYTKNLSTVTDLFPKSIVQMEQLKFDAMKQAEYDIKSIIAVPKEQRTYANTFGMFDQAYGHFRVASSCNSVVRYVSTDAALRETSQKIGVELSKFAIDLFGHNVDLYNTLKDYAQNNAKKEQLTSEQWYFIHETLKGFKRAGLELSAEIRSQIVAVEKELSALMIDFKKNIADDVRFIEVSRDELQGLEEDFIEALEKTHGGKYKLGIDYPTYFTTMEFCSVASTRKQLFELFNDRAYPQNKHVLEQIVAKRGELAQLLGYPSYAHLNLDDEMVKTPERAQEFIDNLLSKAQEKEREEFAERSKDLPSSVILTQDGKMQPWDNVFVSAYYKKKKFNFDERRIAEYFPMETTVKGLLKIYESFFALEMKQRPVTDLWHEDVFLIEVYRSWDRQLLGYLFLDLYPRPNKYNHACQITIVPATKNNDGTINPAVAVVLANFQKSTPKKPSLLKRAEVKTFFHEFGHAIHAILGATDIISFSGTAVKTDFVEMPSQMLEYWLFDRGILKMISKHYQTGESLPDDVIDTIIALKNFNAGAYITRQLFLAQFSLQIYGSEIQKDLDALQQQLWENSLLFTRYDNDDHAYASFEHLTGYGAGYYSYMWSNVFAADLFYFIKPYGLLNPDIGTVYAKKILAPGGSVDPNELLKNFLGREPNQKAFLQDVGLK